MIKILNLKHEQPTEPYDVYIDRTSSLGNIFYMKDESYRDDVCDMYQTWFNDTVLTHKQASSYQELLRLISIYKKYKKLRLFCWCYPKRCHGETIKEYILIETGKGLDFYKY